MKEFFSTIGMLILFGLSCLGIVMMTLAAIYVVLSGLIGLNIDLKGLVLIGCVIFLILAYIGRRAL